MGDECGPTFYGSAILTFIHLSSTAPFGLFGFHKNSSITKSSRPAQLHALWDNTYSRKLLSFPPSSSSSCSSPDKDHANIGAESFIKVFLLSPSLHTTCSHQWILNEDTMHRQHWRRLLFWGDRKTYALCLSSILHQTGRNQGTRRRQVQSRGSSV